MVREWLWSFTSSRWRFTLALVRWFDERLAWGQNVVTRWRESHRRNTRPSGSYKRDVTAAVLYTSILISNNPLGKPCQRNFLFFPRRILPSLLFARCSSRASVKRRAICHNPISDKSHTADNRHIAVYWASEKSPGYKFSLRQLSYRQSSKNQFFFLPTIFRTREKVTGSFYFIIHTQQIVSLLFSLSMK